MNDKFATVVDNVTFLVTMIGAGYVILKLADKVRGRT